MPMWLRPIVGWLMPKVGPKGLEFARARVEMKAIETILHLRRERPAMMKNMVPAMSGRWLHDTGWSAGKTNEAAGARLPAGAGRL